MSPPLWSPSSSGPHLRLPPDRTTIQQICGYSLRARAGRPTKMAQLMLRHCRRRSATPHTRKPSSADHMVRCWPRIGWGWQLQPYMGCLGLESVGKSCAIAWWICKRRSGTISCRSLTAPTSQILWRRRASGSSANLSAKHFDYSRSFQAIPPILMRSWRRLAAYLRTTPWRRSSQHHTWMPKGRLSRVHPVADLVWKKPRHLSQR